MIYSFKKGNRDQKSKIYKQVRDLMVWKQVEDTAQGLL